MSGLRKFFKTNSVKETEGVKFEFHEAPNDDGTIPFFILSRMGKSNKAYSKALEAASRPYRRQLELSTLKNEIADEMFKGVFVNTVLKGWGNIQDEKGQDIPFTRENALALLNEEGMGDLYDRLQQEAGLSSNFRDAALAAELGN